jgi:hypothetical protein
VRWWNLTYPTQVDLVEETSDPATFAENGGIPAIPNGVTLASSPRLLPIRARAKSDTAVDETRGHRFAEKLILNICAWNLIKNPPVRATSYQG